MSDFWAGKRVFVTGLNGFVGSSMSRFLLSEGAQVTGLVHDWSSRHSDVLDRCDVFVGDVTDRSLLQKIISSNEIDVIFHFAAYSIVRISAVDPVSTYATNVMGVVNLLEAARVTGKCSAIVVASSDKAYGDHDELPYLETHALQPTHTYDTSKACADLVARSYAMNYNMPITVSRCSNIYGPGDYNFSRLIPNSIRRLLDGKAPEIYADVGSMEREFIYIDDVISAYDLAAKHIDVLKGNAFNIGGSGPMSIRDVLEMVCRQMDVDHIEPVIIPRSGVFKEIQRQYIDSSYLRSITGWSQRTPLNEGISRTIDWYRNNK